MITVRKHADFITGKNVWRITVQKSETDIWDAAGVDVADMADIDRALAVLNSKIESWPNHPVTAEQVLEAAA